MVPCVVYTIHTSFVGPEPSLSDSISSLKRSLCFLLFLFWGNQTWGKMKINEEGEWWKGGIEGERKVKISFHLNIIKFFRKISSKQFARSCNFFWEKNLRGGLGKKCGKYFPCLKMLLEPDQLLGVPVFGYRSETYSLKVYIVARYRVNFFHFFLYFSSVIFLLLYFLTTLPF